jgi:aryl carrier-like protein
MYLKPYKMKKLNDKRNILDNDEVGLESLVFMQLIEWLHIKGSCLHNYEELLSVAPRRGQLQSKVWKRKSDQKLVVLKTFNRLNLKTIQRAILNEIVVPFIIDSKHILKPSDFFIENEVISFL